MVPLSLIRWQVFRSIAASLLLSSWVLSSPAADISGSLVDLNARANEGDIDSREKLGIALAYGRGITRDVSEARRLLEAPAEAGRPAAQIVLASLYATASADPSDMAKSLVWSRAAANSGYANAQLAVGMHYHAGLGMQRDLREARKWFEAAAAQGNTKALESLVGMYMRGEGVERDADRALGYAIRAAELGSIEGQVTAANIIRSGRTSQQHDAKFADALLLAAANHPTASPMRAGARFRLGLDSYLGRKRERDGPAAIKWLTAAMKDKHDGAGLILAVCYWKGFGAPSDPKRAESLFTNALSTASAASLNNIAWVLSVEPQDAARDGERALRIMQRLMIDPKQRTPQRLDTLAAAYAETGQFDLAVKTQTEALGLIRVSTSVDVRKGYQTRLDLYTENHSYREEF